MEKINSLVTTDPRSTASDITANWLGIVIDDINMPQLDGLSLLQQQK
jgi:YesN/AraC family two-component response regulator